MMINGSEDDAIKLQGNTDYSFLDTAAGSGGGLSSDDDNDNEANKYCNDKAP